jgi:nucleoside-diphosphate-sugar epimerase
MSRTALLTGVTGFIGGKLARRLLAEGWTVHALLRESSAAPAIGSVQVHRHDGSVAGLTQIVQVAAPDVVFHLASLYLADHRPDQVDDLIGSNVLLAAQLAEAMTAAGATRLVDTGTAWQHFQTPDYHPVNLYAATKQAAHDLLLYYHSVRGLSVLTLKLFDTYGAGDTRRKIVQLLVDAALSGEELGMSPGEQVVDLSHVDDVADAFIVAAERLLETSERLNESYFVTGERITVRDLVPLVASAIGRPVNATFGARPYRVREVMMPVDAGAQLLPNWQRRRSLADTLASLASG